MRALTAALVLGGVLRAAAGEQEHPAATDPRQAISEGVKLHDAGDFEGAIRAYDAGLKSDPENVSLLYEKAYSTFSKGDAAASLGIAERIAPRAGRLAPAVQALIGNCYDQLKHPSKAIAAYEKGLEAAPDDPNLLFNLAVTRLSLHQGAEARAAVKRELARRPDHASGHLLLAKSYAADGYRVPAILAYVRFLGLESGTPRAKTAAQALGELLDRGVERKSAKNIEITLPTGGPRDEGDFSGDEAAIAIGSAARFTPPDSAASDLEQRAKQISTVIAMIAELHEKESPAATFVGASYLPYAIELNRRHLAEPFAYSALAAAGVSGASEWVAAHRERAEELAAFSRGFGKRAQP